MKNEMEITHCPICDKESHLCRCPTINRGSFSQYVEPMTDRLLTEEEISASIKWLYKLDEYEAGDFFSMAMREIAKAQDIKTASIMDAENKELGLLLESLVGGIDEFNGWDEKGWRAFRQKILMVIKVHYAKLKSGDLKILWEDFVIAGQEDKFVYGRHQFQKGEDKGKKQGRLAGIKEVVEWIQENEHTGTYNIPGTYGGRDYPSVYVDTEEWQAKLKEWGIWKKK